MKVLKFRAWDGEMHYQGRVLDEDDNLIKTLSGFFKCYCENVDRAWIINRDINEMIKK